MTSQTPGTKKLDKIIEKVIEAINKSKEEIFDISENARKECKKMELDLKDLKEEAKNIIVEVEILSKKMADAKKKLLMVNKDFKRYSQEDFRKAYEEADAIRLKLELRRQDEKYLIQRRNDLEIRLKDSYKMMERSENLINSIGITLGYLNGELLDLSDKMEDFKSKQELAIRVIKAQEDERHRVAREIHDGPAQTMSNVVLKAEICEKLLDIDLEKVRLGMQDMKAVTRDCLKDIRRIIYDLRPMSLDDLGLVPTLNRYFQTFQQDNEIKVSFKSDGNCSELDSVVTIALFRIAQECLNNIKKYSMAGNVLVRLEKQNSGDDIYLEVKDDGIGFDVERAETISTNTLKGFGIFGMKERVNLLSGKFKLESKPGEGTTVEVTIPLKKRL